MSFVPSLPSVLVLGHFVGVELHAGFLTWSMLVAVGIGLLFLTAAWILDFRGFGVTHVGHEAVLPSVPAVSFRPSWFRRALVCLIWTSLCRVGEAALPGPETQQWSLGVFNSAGLPGKGHLIPTDVDVWIASETHLSKKAERFFRHSLKSSGSPYRFLGGHPVPPRSVSSELGSWSGVGFLSKGPVRPVPHGWDPLHFLTSRLQVATMQVGDAWLTGIAFYGAPTGPTQPRAKQLTEELLSSACDRLACCRGLAFLGGDFNHDVHQLPSFKRLIAMGYVEVQELMFRRTGTLPKPTCRHKTQRDLLWICPALAAMFSHCVVNHDVWVDHATVHAVFHGTGRSLMSRVWPRPQPLDWSKQSPCRASESVPFDPPHDPTVQYRKVWELVENQVPVKTSGSGVSVGRAQTFAPVPLKQPAPHIRTGRPDSAPVVATTQNWLHFHRFRQARRIQSLTRLLVSVLTPSHVDHLASLWNVILKSPGYKPSFAAWWQNEVRFLGAPPIGLLPPSRDQALLILQVVNDDVKRLGNQLHQHQVHLATLRRKHDPYHVFRAVRRDPPKPVDAIFDMQSSQVCHVDAAHLEVSLSSPIEVPDDAEVFVAGRPVSVLAHCEDSLWLDQAAEIAEGDTVVARRPLRSLDAMFEAFCQHWKTRWGKHESLPWTHWQEILDFASRYLPSIVAPRFDPSPALIRWCASKKKKLAAAGPDGVRREDLLALSDCELESLSKLFRRAMSDGQWPQQLLEGSIKCLAKKTNPQGVVDYRPVTIYSIVYRVWSSLAARHYLHHLEPILDCKLFGSRMGRRASQVWRMVLDEVEASQHDDCPVGGICFDLHAAFNLLPRCPVLGFASCVGIDSPTLVAWTSFLTSQVRRFQLHGQVSHAVGSSCGFPEGCALSCIAMALTDQVLHLWLKCSTPTVECFTYVDDWEVLASSAACLDRALQATKEFATAMDLTIDPRKSYAWGSSRSLRQDLKPLGLPLVLDSRVLGAHVVYSRQIRNATIQHQLRELPDFWTKLSQAYGAFSQKTEAIRVSAWPRVLHSVSSTVLGLKHFTQLRSDAMSALGLQKPGANPLLQFALDKSYLDPLLFAAVVTLRDHRALGGSDAHLHRLDACALEAHGVSSSVSGVFVQRMHQLGVAVGPQGQLRDSYGAFNFLTASWQEIDLRLKWSWKMVVAQAVAHRSPFVDFPKVDVSYTGRFLDSLPPCDQGVYRRVLNGSLLTNAEAWRWSESGTLECQFCKGADSAWHRFWDCPHTEDLRATLPSGFLDLLPSLPSVASVHGWILDSSVAHQWRSCLLGSSVDFSPQVPLPCGAGSVVNLFTDGSCLWPTEVTYRVASWSVILAPPGLASPSVLDASVVSAGFLPGIIQTPFRSELFALAVALACCVEQGVGGLIKVWSDCQSVVFRCNMLIRGEWTVTASHPHHDLWQWVSESLDTLGKQRVQVFKVKAHVDQISVRTSLEKWCAVFNFCADEAAKMANLQRSRAFWNLWTRHAEETAENRWVGELLAKHQIACMHRWFRSGDTAVEVTTHVPRVGRVFTKQWEPPEVLQVGQRFCRAFGDDLARRFLGWWQQVFGSSDSELQWISFTQLFIHWVTTTGHPGVIKHGKGWLDGGKRQANPCSAYNVRTRTKWFRLMCREFAKSSGFKFACASLKPRSNYLFCHIGCLSAPLNPGVWEGIETWLGSRVLKPIKLPEQLDTLKV